jgi:hypothetical protein
MEILESQYPEKRRLIEASDRHKRALEKGVLDLSKDTKKVLTNALIIGGVLALSYLAVRTFSSSGGGKKKKHRRRAKVTLVSPSVSSNGESDDEDHEEAGPPNLLAGIGTQVMNHATVMLIDIAREKLMEYLESRKKGE